MTVLSVRHMYIGAETGLLKGLNVDDGKWDNLTQISSVNRSNEICVMCWQNQNSEDDILYGTRGGLVKSYSTVQHTVSDILQATDNDKQVIKGLFKLDSKYITCTSDGVLSLWQDNDEEKDSTESEPVKIKCGENVSFMKSDPNRRTHVAVGGKENAVKLYDIERSEAGPIFQSKNVRNDFLDLHVPIWDTDVGFMSKSSHSLIVTSTGHHKIRVYDPISVQRRPMIDIEWEEYPITSLCVSPYQDRQVMVGNTVGEQALLDLRNKKCLGKYKGGAGAIRGLQIHPTLPVVVSCGLDRYVRIHDMNTRLITQKFYMKSRLNAFLISSKWGLEDSDTEEPSNIKLEAQEIVDNGEESPVDDALWDSLATVTEDKKVKKHDIQDTNGTTNGSSNPKSRKTSRKKSLKK